MTDTPTAASDASPAPYTAQVRKVQIVAGLIVALGASAALAGAWYFQLVVGLAPCPLCLEQRVPYYVGVPVALVAVIGAIIGKPAVPRIALALAGMMMATTAALAVYHSGIEWGFWAGPTACSGAAPVASSADLLQSLQQARVVRCDEAPWSFLGLSLAGWNALIAIALTLTAFRGSIAR